MAGSRHPTGACHSPLLADRRPRTEKLKPWTWHTDIPPSSPKYRQNSHAHRTWNPPSHRPAYFLGREGPTVWVRISIARFIFRCLPCSCIVPGSDLAYRQVPKVSKAPPPFL